MLYMFSFSFRYFSSYNTPIPFSYSPLPLPLLMRLLNFRSFKTNSAIPKYLVQIVIIYRNRKTDYSSNFKTLAMLLQWSRRRATVRCRCQAVHNTSSTLAELGNTRKHSAAGVVISLDRGLSTHSMDNALSSVSSTSPLQIPTVCTVQFD